jgi:phage terminase small subunit
MLKLQAALVKTSKEFGLTPSARASLDLGDKEPVDPLDEFVIKKAQ